MAQSVVDPDHRHHGRRRGDKYQHYARPFGWTGRHSDRNRRATTLGSLSSTHVDPSSIHRNPDSWKPRHNRSLCSKGWWLPCAAWIVISLEILRRGTESYHRGSFTWRRMLSFKSLGHQSELRVPPPPIGDFLIGHSAIISIQYAQYALIRRLYNKELYKENEKRRWEKQNQKEIRRDREVYPAFLKPQTIARTHILVSSPKLHVAPTENSGFLGVQGSNEFRTVHHQAQAQTQMLILANHDGSIWWHRVINSRFFFLPHFTRYSKSMRAVWDGQMSFETRLAWWILCQSSTNGIRIGYLI